MFITLHSYKGGTGKSLLSVNLAMILATRGNKVCLIDLDLRAPSLFTAFKNNKKYWINDYLNNTCTLEDILNDYTPKHLKEGKLMVGLANPDIKAIRDICSKDRKWEMEALGRIINLNSPFNNRPFDYVIIDSSPGLQYSSINAIVASDLVLMLTSVDRSDQQGTQKMITELYDIFEKKTGIITNKVPPTLLSGKTPFKPKSKQIPIMEMVPCSCDILKSQGDYLFTFNRPDHPITKTFQKIATKIEKIRTTQNPKTELPPPKH
jgi:MinD-like ATPase involved in chromosome partitioning or flagellar assembly